MTQTRTHHHHVLQHCEWSVDPPHFQREKVGNTRTGNQNQITFFQWWQWRNKKMSLTSWEKLFTTNVALPTTRILYQVKQLIKCEDRIIHFQSYMFSKVYIPSTQEWSSPKQNPNNTGKTQGLGNGGSDMDDSLREPLKWQRNSRMMGHIHTHAHMAY